MKQPGWQQGIGAALLLTGWVGGACSQSVDTSMARAVVDQPLSMSVQVRGFDWPASRLTPECLQIQIQQGESGETIAPVRVRTLPSGDDGRVVVQISSPQTVTDAVLTGRLSLLCGADYTREFTVLADPPTAFAAPKRAPAPVRPAMLPPANQVVATVAVAVAPAKAARQITRSDDPPAPPPAGATTTRTLDDAEVQRLVNAVVSALALASTPPPPPAISTAEMPWQDLREEQRQTQSSLLALAARIERNERDTWRDALLVAGGILGLSVGLLVLRLVREGRMPRMGATDSGAARRSRRKRATPRQEVDPSAPSAALPTLDTRSLHPDVAQDSGSGSGSVEWTPPPETEPDPEPGHAPTTRWPGADFGHPSLDTTSASTELLRELDPLVEESPIGVVVVLERRLQALPGKCPWILLRLLALYREMAQPWNHERVAAQLEALYNVRIPDMASAADASTGADLEAYPDTLHRILQAWQQDDPAAALTGLLLQPTVIEVLDQPAFEEALLLHGIVRQRQSAWLTAIDTSPSPPSQRPLDNGNGNSRLMELLAA